MANRRYLAAACAAALTLPVLASGPAQAAPPRVEAMIVGKTATLARPQSVVATAATVRASGRSCRVGAGTPIAVLSAIRQAGGPVVRTRDYGTCSKRPRDAGGLFVTQIGADRNRGKDGWVYKVDGRAGTTPAGDPTGPFGDGRPIRAGQQVLWFWCITGKKGCQRTLRITAAATLTSTDALVVTVDGLDDRGKAVRIPGATVTVGDRTATTNRQGSASLAGPWVAGAALSVHTTAPGAVAAFPTEVTVL